MMRPLTTVGCSLAMVIGTAGFLGCEEQAQDQGIYGTETEINDGLDTQAPALDGTGVGLDTGPMYAPTPGQTGTATTPGSPAMQPGMTEQQEPNTPAVPQQQSGDMGNQPTPGQNTPAVPSTPGGETDTGNGM